MARPKKENTEPTLEAPLTQMDEIQAIAAKEKELAEMKKNIKFNFQKQSQKIHSLYKLLTSSFVKNTSWTSEPRWEEVEHTHFFHSINSAGQPQTTCAPVGGHFHEMILVKAATEAEPAVYKTSGPLKKVRQKNNRGEWVIVSVPANGVDQHTHEVEYRHSEIWSPAAINPEFAKLQAQMAAKIVKSDQFYEQ